MLSKDFDTIVADLQSAYQNALSAADTRRGSDIWVKIVALGSVLEGLYQYLDYIRMQIFPDTADQDNLIHAASLHGITPEAASAAAGHLLITGVAGTAIPAGINWQTTDGSVVGVTTGSGNLDANGELAVAASATTAGVTSNLLLGQAVQLLDPPANVSSVSETTDLWSGGQDAESQPALLARFLDHLRQPPAGGNQHDYEVWAAAVAGVAGAWAYPTRRGLGTVDVLVTAPGTDRIPSADLLAAVQAAIDAVRPCTAKDFQALAPTPVSTGVTVSVLADAGYGGDWTGTHTTAAACTTSELVLDATAGMSAGMRLVVAEEERYIDQVVDGTHVTLASALSAAPASGLTVYPGSPIWQAVYDAIAALFDAIAPPVFVAGGTYPLTRTLYKSQIESIISGVAHVVDRSVSAPAGNVSSTVDSTHSQMITRGAIVITFQ